MEPFHLPPRVRLFPYGRAVEAFCDMCSSPFSFFSPFAVAGQIQWDALRRPFLLKYPWDAYPDRAARDSHIAANSGTLNGSTRLHAQLAATYAIALSLERIRDRDLLAARAEIDAGASCVAISASRSADFLAPQSLSSCAMPSSIPGALVPRAVDKPGAPALWLVKHNATTRLRLPKPPLMHLPPLRPRLPPSTKIATLRRTSADGGGGGWGNDQASGNGNGGWGDGGWGGGGWGNGSTNGNNLWAAPLGPTWGLVTGPPIATYDAQAWIAAGWGLPPGWGAPTFRRRHPHSLRPWNRIRILPRTPMARLILQLRRRKQRQLRDTRRRRRCRLSDYICN
ncbi:hypothetical protein DFH06DRAFT_1342959 [Mycena polygramma]|nr:hypothetical protein DFH06DRAFT_1342959 [Mycena polygramma]